MSCFGAKARLLPLQPLHAPKGKNRWNTSNTRIDVYKAGIEFVALADDIVERLPRGRSYISDQLLRASTSVVLNVAEVAPGKAWEEQA